MSAWRLRLVRLDGRELLLAGAATAVTAVLGFLAVHKLGLGGLLVPVGLVVLLFLLARPLAMVSLVVGLVVLCEGPSFGILTFSSHLYTQVVKDISVMDLLVALAVASVALDLMRKRRSVWIPRPLRPVLVLLALAMAAGAITGHAEGASLRFVIVSEDVLGYLLLLPIAVANLDIDRRQVSLLVGGLVALAVVKAGLGLVEVSSGAGQQIEGHSTLTYYEPTANWLVMMAVLGVFAALVARTRPPLWALLGSPLLLASLLLSYRRSFWIAAVLGLLLVLLLGSSPTGRRLLVPTALCIAVAVWLVGSVRFQSQVPIVKRAVSLSPTSLQVNVEDRYRLDERANVLGEIRQHPITGLGMTIPWAATERPLPVEHEGGREYVHFAALWFWLKLGILGLFTYVGVMLASLTLAWQAWRRSREPLLRAYSLASLCGLVGLIVLDTTASFTGVDGRFTVLFAAQLGLLALLAGKAPAPGEQALPAAQGDQAPAAA